MDQCRASMAELVLGRATYKASDIALYLKVAQALLSDRPYGVDLPIYWQGDADMGWLALALVALSRGGSVVLALQDEYDQAIVISKQEFDATCQQVAQTDSVAQTSQFERLICECLIPSQSAVTQALSEYLAALSPSSKVALAAPLTHHYLVFILACWQQGHTVCLPDSLVIASPSLAQAPAAISLRMFEQQQPQGVVADHGTLQTMMQHPAVDLADLSSVERILVVCSSNLSAPYSAQEIWPQTVACQFVFADSVGWLSEVQQRATRQQEYEVLDTLLKVYPMAASDITNLSSAELEVKVQCLYSPECRIQRLEESRRLIERSVPIIDMHFLHDDALEAVRLTYQINRLALLSMLNGLWHGGVFVNHEVLPEAQLMDIAKVASEHKVLIRRWLKVLTTEQMLEESPAGYRLLIEHDAFSDQAMMTAFDTIEPQWRDCMGSSGIIDYARRNARALPDLISGKVQAVHLLFREGRTEFAKALYRENLISQYQHQQVANLVRTIVSESNQKPIRILEIGAGTGATSETVLSELSGLDVDYHYTDVSNFFFEQAADIVKLNPAVTLSLYDIDIAPEAQSFPLYSFDIIIGGGVLNAARHTVSALQGLQRLLRPGGWLLITEPVLEEYWVMASQAFMLNQAEDDRSMSEATFLTHTQWQSALDDAGFIRLAELPSREHPFYQSGHFVFAATTHTDYSPLPFAELQQRLSHALQKPVSLRVQL